jgi:hypothetical protein
LIFHAQPSWIPHQTTHLLRTQQHTQQERNLQWKQRESEHGTVSSIKYNDAITFFIDSPGGTGKKTFLYKTITKKLLSLAVPVHPQE